MLAPIDKQKHAGDAIHAIMVSGRLGDATKLKYARQIERARDAGVDIMAADQVAEYSAGLTPIMRSHLRAALRVHTKRLRLQVNGQATPDNMAAVGAMLARLEALDHAIELQAVKGTSAHVHLSKRQVKKIMTMPTGEQGVRDKAILALLLGAGLRRQELTTLTWGDLVEQGDRWCLNVKGKGNKARVVPISAQLIIRLQRWRAVCSDGTGGPCGPDDLIVRSQPRDMGGAYADGMTTAQVFNIVRKYGAMIGTPQLAPHDLRRTYAQLGYDAGVPLVQISTLLGHASVSVTQRYLNTQLNLDDTVSDYVPV